MSLSVCPIYLFQMSWLTGTSGLHQNLLGTSHPRQLLHFCPQPLAHQLHFSLWQLLSTRSVLRVDHPMVILGWEGWFGFTKPNATCLLHVQAELSGASRAICCSRLCQFWQFLANNIPSASNFKQLAHLEMGKAFRYWSPSCTKGKGLLSPGSM